MREFAKAFYHSVAWRQARAAYIDKRLAVDGGMCELCQDQPGTEVHHKIFLTPENIDDKEISLNPDNFMLLCYDCHQLQHEAARRVAYLVAKQRDARKEILKNGRYYFDDDGELQEFKVYLVWGPPGAGKTTYVREHMEPGDVVVDLDLIGRAMSMADKTDIPGNIERLAFDIRDYLYARIENRTINAKRAWVVAGLPKKKQREEVASKLGAELIRVEASVQECYRHMLHDDERKDKAIQASIINKWFRDYEA